MNTRMRASAITVILFLCFNVSAQEPRTLKIGDDVPNFQFSLLSPTGLKSITKLSDYKGKLVILDFWATWCSTCLSSLPKMDTLQTEFKGKIEVVMVNTNQTFDDEKKIRLFYRRWIKKFPKFKLSTTVADSVLKSYFPHIGLPHYVWIGTDGKVKAITSSNNVSRESIAKILSDGEIKLPLKKDFSATKFLYLGEEETIDINDYEHLSIFKKGRIDNVGTENRKRKRGRAMRNVSILTIYAEIISGLNRELKVSKRMIFEVSKLDDLEWNQEWDQVKTNSEKYNWEERNLYTYDIVIPAAEMEADKLSLYKQMLSDVNRYSPYVGTIEKRKVRCSVLVRTSSKDKLKSKHGNSEFKLFVEQNPYMINCPLKLLISDLNAKNYTSLPILDETNYSENVDIHFAYYGNDISKLREELQNYDLDLIEAEREIEMFVIRDKPPSKAN